MSGAVDGRVAGDAAEDVPFFKIEGEEADIIFPVDDGRDGVVLASSVGEGEPSVGTAGGRDFFGLEATTAIAAAPSTWAAAFVVVLAFLASRFFAVTSVDDVAVAELEASAVTRLFI